MTAAEQVCRGAFHVCVTAKGEVTRDSLNKCLREPRYQAEKCGPSELARKAFNACAKGEKVTRGSLLLCLRKPENQAARDFFGLPQSVKDTGRQQMELVFKEITGERTSNVEITDKFDLGKMWAWELDGKTGWMYPNKKGKDPNKAGTSSEPSRRTASTSSRKQEKENEPDLWSSVYNRAAHLYGQAATRWSNSNKPNNKPKTTRMEEGTDSSKRSGNGEKKKEDHSAEFTAEKKNPVTELQKKTRRLKRHEYIEAQTQYDILRDFYKDKISTAIEKEKQDDLKKAEEDLKKLDDTWKQTVKKNFDWPGEEPPKRDASDQGVAPDKPKEEPKEEPKAGPRSEGKKKEKHFPHILPSHHPSTH